MRDALHAIAPEGLAADRVSDDPAWGACGSGREFLTMKRDGFGIGVVLDAIRRMQTARRVVNRQSGQGFGPASFSARVVEIANRCDTRSALARADVALYGAKEQGRNRVEIG